MSDPLLLAIETSSLHGSLALGRGETLLAYRRLSPERRHAAELLPAIKEMLAEAGCGPRDVGVLAFSQGPGSFTGLRVAATVARMWQSATGCRVVAVPTLEALARNVAAGLGPGRQAPADNRCPATPADSRCPATPADSRCPAAPADSRCPTDVAAGNCSVSPPGRTSGVGESAERPQPPTADTEVGRYTPAGTEPGRYNTPVAVMVDARQGRVYGGVYEISVAPCGGSGAAGDADTPPGLRPGLQSSAPYGAKEAAGGAPSGAQAAGGIATSGAEEAAVGGGGLDAPANIGVYHAAAWIANLPRPCSVLGDGLKVHGDAVRAAGLDVLPEEFWWPDARQVLALGRELAAAGRFCSPAQIVPLYLRPPECEEVYDQRRAEAKARRMASSE